MLGNEASGLKKWLQKLLLSGYNLSGWLLCVRIISLSRKYTLKPELGFNEKILLSFLSVQQHVVLERYGEQSHAAPRMTRIVPA